MASRYYTLNVTTPAGTLIGTPQTTVWQLEDVILTGIEVDVPPGHAANTGIRVLRSQQQVVPWGSNSYLIANDRLLPVAVGEELTEAKLVIITYNLDVYDHTHYLRATMTDFPQSSTGATAGAPAIPTLLLTSNGVVSS